MNKLIVCVNNDCISKFDNLCVVCIFSFGFIFMTSTMYFLITMNMSYGDLYIWSSFGVLIK